MSGANGKQAPLDRAGEAQSLLNAIQDLIIPFIRTADEDASTKHTGHGLAIPGGGPRTALAEQHKPQKLNSLLDLKVPEDGGGKEGLVELVEKVLKYSVNTWDQGFMDKLYGSTDAVGLVSELLLAALNTNAHVYNVSPVLTLIERHVTSYLSNLFFSHSSSPLPHAGGISQPGGSASNATATTIARNTLHPTTKTEGLGNRKFTLFTSAHGHYSLEKAAQIQGLGSRNVISVPVDDAGKMIPAELDQLIKASKSRGETPFFVNATAGTTVLGSFDPFTDIAAVCKAHNLWLHIDGSWGGSVIFNRQYAKSRLAGAEFADSITISPHKMLGVPMTCSFLLGRDLRQFKDSMTLSAGYLFHSDDADEDGDGASKQKDQTEHNANGAQKQEDEATAYFDLADLTPQCGRRADSLKFFLALSYHGSSHFSSFVQSGFDAANHLLSLLKASPHFVVISPEPLPCFQVCFYFAREGKLAETQKEVSKVTETISKRLVQRGFMVDYAPGDRGKFLRAVVHGETRVGSVEGLVKAVEGVAEELEY
ncbi:glutamate decarboxylase 1 [Lophiostoma macrostomum CBS 122681]|uniref:Glutamate decarboxylase 1 n=1 Tax=Lophiostoma macrostomum CBS 122681 TaxID=1314788 RepID=A0A6A6TDI6_9PLEO|nr:glutamate decarboxylase 1 [Lophiostoma macrostomum CBS 122681]